MSSRADHRRRERSWEREDRDRGRDRDRDKDRYSRNTRTGGHRDAGRRRDSRSRSPRRDRRDHDKDRDYKSSRRDDRHDYDRDRDDRRPDRKEDRKSERKSERKDERRDHYTPERTTSRDKIVRSKEPPRLGEPQRPQDTRSDVQFVVRTQSPKHDVPVPTSSKPILDPDTPVEEGEEMDVTTAEDESMTAMMGLTGFGSTKGKHVEGNQEGTTNVKKIRTWRQYMNRRGGFNRPLDKIK
ncbi:hypothetical protein J3R83DRAFT_4825 [Lanmaoa asiatica]|nr:hypothetical protein J3R83DRAFT_4825 [Lanmaoa asiatica]